MEYLEWFDKGKISKYSLLLAVYSHETDWIRFTYPSSSSFGVSWYFGYDEKSEFYYASYEPYSSCLFET